MNSKIKYVFVVTIAFLLWLPLMQFNFEVFDIAPLEGDAISITQEPELTKSDYLDLIWQENYNRYLNDNFGFRPNFVRLINQLRFSLFNGSTARSVIVGKNGQLFTESYINDYIGRTYVGTNKVLDNVTKIKTLQDSLKSRGKDLIVVFAPGKASFYPEYIPDNYLSKKKDSTNYKVYADLFAKQKVNFIDLNKWFADNKTKFKHPVYPQYGAHWNHYGMNLGMDSILRYIERKRNINIPDYDYSSKVNYTDDLKGHDFDIGILLNIWSPLKKDSNPYPEYVFKSDQNFMKPDVLTVGDSYWWCMLDDNLPAQFFKEDVFWFYNEDVVYNTQKTGELVKKINLSAAMGKRDVVMLVATEATLYLFPYGFIDNAYKLYCKDHSKRYNEIIAGINLDKEWYNTLLKKAEENKTTIDQQMRLDAEYIIYEEIMKPVETLEMIMERIQKDEKWMKDIRRKAKENGLSEEQQLHDDAQWLVDQQNK